jgi:hypothetical protein
MCVFLVLMVWYQNSLLIAGLSFYLALGFLWVWERDSHHFLTIIFRRKCIFVLKNHNISKYLMTKIYFNLKNLVDRNLHRKIFVKK